jgi:hypothetical protein
MALGAPLERLLTESSLRAAVSLDPHATRPDTFAEQFARKFSDRFAPLDNRHLQSAIELSWSLPPMVGNPGLDRLMDGIYDPSYRDRILQQRAVSPLEGTVSDALTETDLVIALREQLRDDRSPISVGARAVLGESAQTELGLGRIGLRGYPRLTNHPGDFVGMTYDLGPFHVRAGGYSTSAGLSTSILGNRVYAGGTVNYAGGEPNPRVTIVRPLDRFTSLSLIGGYGVDSFLLPGNVPFPEDPRDRRSVGILLFFDTRF